MLAPHWEYLDAGSQKNACRARPDVSRHRDSARGRSTPRAGSSSTRPSGQARGQALDQDEHDPPPRLGAERPTSHRQGAARPLADNRPSSRRSVTTGSKRAACSTGPSTASASSPTSSNFLVPMLKRDDTRHSRQSRVAQGKVCPRRRQSRWRAPPLWQSRLGGGASASYRRWRWKCA
jgi:hypothetical protein